MRFQHVVVGAVLVGVGLAGCGDGKAVDPIPSGAAGPAPTEWHTVRYEGEPVAESGDGRVVLDVPGDWQRLDTSGCEFAWPRFGPSGVDPCQGEVGVSLYGAATFDAIHGPGLLPEDSGETEAGYVYTGQYAVHLAGASHEVARRVLASARLDGVEIPDLDAAWSRQEVQGVAVEVPAAGVEVSVSSASVRADFPVGVTLAEQRGTRWIGRLQLDGSHLVEVDAPTQALAEIVASSGRL